MDKKTFLGLWILDSRLSGMDPIARFINNAYILLLAPMSFFALVALLTDTNYFFIMAVFLKGIWYFWVKTIWFLLTHYEHVVWLFRNLISPGCCGDGPDF